MSPFKRKRTRVPLTTWAVNRNSASRFARTRQNVSFEHTCVRAWPPSWTHTRTREAVQGVKSGWWGATKAWSSALVPAAAAAAAGHPRVPARFEASCTTRARILVHLWWNNGGGIKRGNEPLCGRIWSWVELRRSGAPEGNSQKVFLISCLPLNVEKSREQSLFLATLISVRAHHRFTEVSLS